MAIKKRIEDMHKMAASHQGKCLSKRYVNSRTKLQWQCKEGHKWKRSPNATQRGQWCSTCLKQQSGYTIEDMQAFAKAKGGKCLSKSYKNSKLLLKWRCKKGHVWEVKAASVIHGHWCNECRKLSLEDIQKKAKSRGGKCLSKVCEDSRSLLEFECKYKHRWSTKALNISKGRWCPKCGEKAKSDGNRIYDYKTVKELVSEYGGKLLSKSKDYTNIHTRINIECQHGHQWNVLTYSIVSLGTWCPFCSKSCKKTMQDMQAIAAKHFGQCVSKKYKNYNEKLTWQCQAGHQWKAIYAVANKTWCAACKGKKQRVLPSSSYGYCIETMQYLARERGWKVISKTYKNVNTALQWRCEKGHQFKMLPSSVIKGGSCTVCTIRKHTIEGMKKLAKKKGGQCLSSKYVNVSTVLTWRCKNKHEWKTAPTNILRGRWCKICAAEARASPVSLKLTN